MKITTWNLNGIRAVWSHVMPYCLQSTYAEIYCFQETKLQKPDANLSIPDYWSFFSCAYDMHSYSGTAVYTKIRPLRLSYSMSTEASAFIEITKPSIGAQLYKSYWLSEGDSKASSVWLENGFAVSELDLDGEKVTFKRVRTRYSRIKIPDWVYRNTLPDGVCDEVEKYFKYVEKKYGLK